MSWSLVSGSFHPENEIKYVSVSLIITISAWVKPKIEVAQIVFSSASLFSLDMIYLLWKFSSTKVKEFQIMSSYSFVSI